jgi:AraC-like DNA-binding protein
MQWCLERMMRELREPQPGGFLLGQHLAHIMLVEALRLYLSNEVNPGVGWLLALGDKQMLAQLVGMSRSKFALRFKEKVGVSAMEYLTRWRMLRAADRLTNSPESVTDIAISVGYESESSFGAAFKKVMGLSPRQYCRARAAASLQWQHTAHP